MTRGQLEQRYWHGLRDLGLDRHPLAPAVVDNLLDAADLYAATRNVEYHAALAASDTPGNTQLRREELADATRRTG